MKTCVIYHLLVVFVTEENTKFQFDVSENKDAISPIQVHDPSLPPHWISPLGPLGVWEPKAKYPCCNSRTEKEYSQSYHVENKM